MICQEKVVDVWFPSMAEEDGQMPEFVCPDMELPDISFETDFVVGEPDMNTVSGI